ncbi:hypothetical protein C6I20_14425 [Aeromicrobium sp. A1-2]|nr:hypothetical protein C6I20_14425 [Aeromicrobium sp. A1-2]
MVSSVFGAKMPRASWDFIRGVEIWLPSVAEQKGIAEYLDRETAQIDTLIEEQQRLVEMLHERRKSLVDRGVFGLDSGKPRELRLIGRHRAVEPLLANTPAHWGIQRFLAVLKRVVERNSDLSEPMMSLKSTGEIVRRDSLGGRQEPDEGSLPKYLVTHPDSLVVNPMWLIGGAIGVSQVDGAVSPDYRVFDVADAVHPRYLHHLLRSSPYIDQYMLYTRAQTTFDRRVQQPELNNLPIPLPPMEEQIEIAVSIDEQAAKIDSLIAEAERFIELSRERRSALITAAVTGQIDVREQVA